MLRRERMEESVLRQRKEEVSERGEEVNLGEDCN